MNIHELKLNGWRDELGNLWNNPLESEWVEYKVTDIVAGGGRGTWYTIPGWFIGLDKDLVINSYLRKELEDHGRTMEEYAARFLHNLSEIPECSNPSCHNKVHLDSGKIWNGFTKTCCKSCGQSLSNIKRWQNPNDYLNQSEFRELKSKEMTENIQEWNYNPEFQAKCKLGKFLSHRDGDDYVMYFAITESNLLKFGITRLDWVDYRCYIQSEYNNDPYKTIHIVKVDWRDTIGNLEYNMKSKFGFKEYLDLSQLPELIKVFRELR